MSIAYGEPVVKKIYRVYAALILFAARISKIALGKGGGKGVLRNSFVEE